MSTGAPRGPWPALARRVALSALVGYLLIAAYGQWHYLLPWHVEENVPVRENGAVDSFEGTKRAYFGNRPAESRGVYKDDSELDAYVIGTDGQVEEVQPWQVQPVPKAVLPATSLLDLCTDPTQWSDDGKSCSR